MTLRRSRLAAAFPLAVVLMVLSGCAQTVAMNPAVDANNPRCADISVRLPQTVAGKAQRTTNAQATGAWGNPAVVLLRCGVPPIGPTTKPCVTVSGIDWVLESDPSATVFRYITFGRIPATEVVISHAAGGVSDASVLPDLASAVGSVSQSRTCLSTPDVSIPNTVSTPPAQATSTPKSSSTPTR